MCALVTLPGVAIAADRVPVLTVTEAAVNRVQRQDVCWDTIVTGRQRAREEYARQPWLIKYWKPILGGVLGGLVGFEFTRHYGQRSRKWIYPTVAGGVAAGAITGPGFVLGARGFGQLAYTYLPRKLSILVGVSLLGGVLGDLVFNLLFPDKPAPSLMAKPVPGEYLPDQQFFVQTTCVPQVKVKTTESSYRITYDYQGTRRTALVKHYPRDFVTLDGLGAPLDAVAQP